MQTQHRSDSSDDPAQFECAGQRMKTPTGAVTTPHITQVAPEDDDPIEDWLEFYNFHYILERVKKTIQFYPSISLLPEEIASEIYGNFWQKLLKGPVDNPPAYIGMMIRNKCVDYMRRRVSEFCHLVERHTEEGLDILESDQVAADSEGLRDPAEEFEYGVALQDMYRRVSLAIAELPPRQQQAMAWHILRRAPDPEELKEVFDVLHITVPVVHNDKDEEHLLEASYTHARKALAKRLNVDLSQFHQRKHQKCM